MINKLSNYANQNNLNIIDDDMKEFNNAKGFIYNNTILIKKGLSAVEYNEILAEEIGHYETSYGNILDMTDIRNEKQELRARQWAYEELISFEKIIEVFHARISGPDNIADYLDVTVEFLENALKQYKEKYGIYVKYNDYIIYFDPLGVMKTF